MAETLQVRFELDGWTLLFAHLERLAGAGDELAALRQVTVGRARERLQIENLANQPAVAALRRLFRAAGCDPTRYRPSSEALLRRVLKGSDLPAINPVVDINNCLSVELAVPCCVMAEDSVEPPYVLRPGRPGESYESLKGPFNLESKPLLVDGLGPCDAPITGSQRVKIGPDSERAWLVAYLPTGVVTAETVRETVGRLLTVAPVARLLSSCHRPTESEETQENQDG